MALRMAKASPGDIDALRDYLLELEEAIDSDDVQAIADIAKRFPIGWRRVVEGYWILVENACDPDKNYLAWKPELVDDSYEEELSA